MAESRAAYRYALALIEIAEESQKSKEISGDFMFIEELLKASRDLAVFLKSPVISTQKKKVIFKELLGGRISDITLEFIFLLTSKDREGLLPEIIRQFYALRDQRSGVLNAVARSVVHLTEEQKGVLLRSIRQLTKKDVRLTYELDASLIGGFTVRFDDTVLDASVKHHLEVLRERFATP